MQLKGFNIISLVLIVCPIWSLYCQVDTTLYVPEVKIESFKIRSAVIGANQYSWDKAKIASNKYLSLGDFLQRESNVYVKSYGGNSLSTLSVRGAGASQTLVLWNGLPIQSVMLGLLDMSLIPLNLVDEVNLQAGGNSSAWGSGAIGGVISLDNQANFDNKIGLNYFSSIGSFGNLNQQATIDLGNKVIQSRTQMLFQKAKNDISYKADPLLPRTLQSNAAFLQSSIMQSIYLKPNAKNQLAFHAWLQKSDKELPATLTQRKSLASQEDKFKRFLLSWDYFKNHHKLSTKFGYFREEQTFLDPQIALIAQNDFNTILAEISYGIKVKKNHGLEFTNTNNFNQAFSKSYKGSNTLFRTALCAAYKFESKKLALQFSLREELVNKKLLLPTAFVGAELRIANAMLLKSKITRDFRLPTLNDLYWSPGGNPDLLPEQGWSEEIGMVYTKHMENHSITATQTMFNRNIDNWILWAPSTNAYWSANNIAKVWSWGSESSLSYRFHRNRSDFSYTFNANYTSSTYRVSIDLPKIEKGDQLLYVPKYQFSNQLQFAYGDFSVRYQQLFFAKTKGANEDLPAYQIANMQLSYNFRQNNYAGQVFFGLNNIFNATYLVVERRPMPGINYQIGMNINFNK